MEMGKKSPKPITKLKLISSLLRVSIEDLSSIHEGPSNTIEDPWRTYERTLQYRRGPNSTMEDLCR